MSSSAMSSSAMSRSAISRPAPSLRTFPTLAVMGRAALSGVLASAPSLAATPISESRALDPRGRVEIENLKGRIEVRAWDRPEVKIEGSLGSAHRNIADPYRAKRVRTQPLP